MIAVDTGILVQAHREDAPKHEAAQKRLVELAEGSRPWAIPVFCLGEFLRVLTHPGIFETPHSAEEAAEALRRLLESPSLVVLLPKERYPRFLLEAMTEGDARGNLAPDAQIVAVCREWGVDRVLSEDRDFRRWKGMRVESLG